MSKILDITDQRYGMLVAISRTEQRSGTSYKWLCHCDCGGQSHVATNNLRTGHTDNCGCLTKDRKRESSTIHGMSKSSEYQCWQNMKSRCLDEKDKQFPYYGGRGISIQKDWIENFQEFLKCVGKKPDVSFTLERIDNNGDYCFENVKWVSRQHQSKNRGKFKNNSTGITGVNLVRKNDTWYYIAIWEENGKQRNRVFSTNKYGWLPAMAKAISIRKEKIENLRNTEGYSKIHGEDRKIKL